MKSNLMKRYLIMSCVVLLGGMGLTGCQKESVNSTQTNTEVTTQTSTDSTEDKDIEQGTSKIVSTVMGDVEVPVNPQRIVVNWYLGDVVTLGIKPVAIYGWIQESMPFYDMVKEIPAIETWDKEEILTYEPDLIITYDQEDFDKFSQIAPVIVVPESVTSVERIEFLGEVTGHEAEAKEAISTFEQKLEEAKELLTSAEFSEKTFSILSDWGSNSYGIYYESDSRGGTLLHHYLNLKQPESLTKLIEDSGEGRGSVSYEVAADYFGDYVLWFLVDENESEYAQTEIWNNIPAVKEGNIIEIPASFLGLFYFSDVASMSAQMDYIIDKLNDVVENK
ncbi:iron complex transport system substrate-binding protein [Lachnotalea glycerini]|uniref:Iron complex transport system substrate-binding protein n=1 Tax=Lachnotalea glycerini TaxID=1763509 RepID=A0A318EPB1_9FIRM|nr:ABC transporter substrate-binding protein [Lachnotalea glycerini]PXV91206.1 iron complex transport system substrate-binding protein [Lachnotalea glycerini]